ncbi:unnamed protein product [Sphagnum troendelagicum]|uniref:Uncharacterized protein n=2 Tax=Sphagnum troendelagicum TaxID=128251 RepID=A0ABP0TJL3_9BRYO
MRGSGTYKEKERQKAVLSGTMVVGLAVNCGMLPWLFKEHLPVHLSQSVYSGGVLEAAGDGSGKRVSEAAGDGFAKRLQVMGAVESPVKCEASKEVPKG